MFHNFFLLNFSIYIAQGNSGLLRYYAELTMINMIGRNGMK